jgi:hypothetical protein
MESKKGKENNVSVNDQHNECDKVCQGSEDVYGVLVGMSEEKIRWECIRVKSQMDSDTKCPVVG